MDCQSCATPSPRADKPHTFFAHQQTSCPSCGDSIEGRVVLRAGAVVNLTFCPRCGQGERPVADDARAWVEAFLARGLEAAARRDGQDRPFKRTTSTCPGCRTERG